MIYLDHHATTPVDPTVLEAMLPWMTQSFGNPHSHTHQMGRMAAAACASATANIAAILGVSSESLLITSGATESNNLAIQGVLRHPRQRRRRIVTVTTEHPSVLDPIRRLGQEGWPTTLIEVQSFEHRDCGQLNLDALRQAVDEETALVSVMLANNEIGVIQPLAEIAAIAHAAGALVHCDATQAIGYIPIDLRALDVDLLSGSAHKFYGPKGVGFLALGPHRRVRLRPLFEGGGQQQGLRSGTVNVPGLIGMSAAMTLATQLRDTEGSRIATLRDELWYQLQRNFAGIELNGPALAAASAGERVRLPHNLNVSFRDVEGETLMAASPELAVSSGAACSSVDPRPSHVLMAIGLSESRARRSLRFGLGRGTTSEIIAEAVAMLVAAHHKVLAK